MSNQLLRQRSISEIISHSFQFYGAFFKIFFTILFTTAIPFLMLNSFIIFMANTLYENPTSEDRFIVFIILVLVFIVYMAIYIGFIAEFTEAYRLNPENLSFRELIFRFRKNAIRHVFSMALVLLLIYPFGFNIDDPFYSNLTLMHTLKFLIVITLFGGLHMINANYRGHVFGNIILSIKLNIENFARSFTVSILLSMLFAIIIYGMVFVLLQVFSIPALTMDQVQAMDFIALILIIIYSFFILCVLPAFFLGFFFNYYDSLDRSNNQSLLDKIDGI